MPVRSAVEWTATVHADGSITEGTSWSVVTGCTKKSTGCLHCYAKREVEDRWSKNPNSVFFGREFSDVLCHPEQLATSMRWRKSHRVFVCPRSDLFHEDVSFEFLAAVFGAMAASPTQTFLIPTKRPERAAAFLQWLQHEAGRTPGSTGPAYLCLQQLLKQGANLPVSACGIEAKAIPWPLPNVQIGATVERQKEADERLPHMAEIARQGWITGVSYEPALGPVDWRPWVKFIKWLVAGGETGGRPAHPAWFRIARDQCRMGNVAFFFKQWGDWLPISELSDSGNSLYRSVRVAKFAEDQAILDDVYGRRCTVETASIGFDGETGHWRMIDHYPAMQVFKVGKRKAGAVLDGATHKEYPVLGHLSEN